VTTIDLNKHIQKHRTREEILQALSDMCHRIPTIHVPRQVEDTDVILYDAIKELFDLREQVQKIEAIERRAHSIDQQVQTMIENLMELQKEQVL
jgi:hypothetical protein